MDPIIRRHLDGLVTSCFHRRTEQAEDNRARLGSRSVDTARGVNYCEHRKEIAQIIHSHIITKNGHFTLDEVGVHIFIDLQRNGIRRETIKSWLKKYQNFTAKLFTSL